MVQPNTITGTNGSDNLKGTDNNDLILGLRGADVLEGRLGDDTLDGGKGNDSVEGNKGNDTMIGGEGNDTLEWEDGDGSDRISGDTGQDVVEVEGSIAQGDDFLLKQSGHNAIFDRLNLVPFKLTVDTSETFEVEGEGGDDRFTVEDLSATDVQNVEFSGDKGNDTLNGAKTSTVIEADGGAGDDFLVGGTANDTLAGGSGNDLVVGFKGNDLMTGGAGNDTLVWADGDGSDRISGDAGKDVVGVQGSLAQGDEFTLQQSGANAIFKRVNLVPFKLTVDTSETFNVSGEGGDDSFTVKDLSATDVKRVQVSGGEGNDTLDGSKTSTVIEADGGAGDDQLTGGSAKDTLVGGSGNDDIEGEKGNDIMIGGDGNDTLGWDDGDGSDRISGNEGYDVVEVEGSVAQGDEFVLQQSGSNAIFKRVNLVPFKLTVDTSEKFEVSGEGGDDSFTVKDLSATDVKQVKFSGEQGNDTLNASKSQTPVEAEGGGGKDWLLGGFGADVLRGDAGKDTLNGGAGVDTLTGGDGADQFAFDQNALGTPDILTDFEIGKDQFALDSRDLGIKTIQFQKGEIDQITQNANVIVLEGAFANAGLAAEAIAANEAITSDKGAFVYFNSTLGISRLVYSEDLGDGGKINVLGNLIDQTHVGNQALFSENNFSLI